jgi:hypothetical protein
MIMPYNSSSNKDEQKISELLSYYAATMAGSKFDDVAAMKSYLKNNPTPAPAPSDLPDPLELVRKHSKRKF